MIYRLNHARKCIGTHPTFVLCLCKYIQNIKYRQAEVSLPTTENPCSLLLYTYVVYFRAFPTSKTMAKIHQNKIR